MAHGVEGVQEVVVGERLVREPSEEGKVGGGDPGAELGRTLSGSRTRLIAQAVRWVPGEGEFRDRTSAPNSVDRLAKLEILGQGPEQPNRPGPARIVVLHPIQDRIQALSAGDLPRGRDNERTC